jgi:hypothetical protein
MTTTQRFRYLPLASDHDLIGAYIYAHAVMGHGGEPWLVWALSEWLTAAKAELKRRDLLKDAQRAKRLMWKDHHARRAVLPGRN